MPRALADFSPIYTTEQVVLTFDFSLALGVGETIVTLPPPSVSIALVSGTDATPSLRLIGNPSIIGSAVLQVVGAYQPGATYDLIATVTTNGNQILTVSAHQQCFAIA